MNSHFHHDHSASPVFTPMFATGGFDTLEDVDEQLGFGLSLDSPIQYDFSNDIAYDEEEVEQAAQHQQPAHDDKAALMMRSHTQRDTSFGPMMIRGFDAFIETNVMEATSGKAPVFVLDKLPMPSPLNNGSGFFDFSTSLTIAASDKFVPVPASPQSPTSYVSNVEVPEKEHSDFYSVNQAFTSSESPAKIMGVVQSALSTLRSQVTTSSTKSPYTLSVRCLLVAEEIHFSIHLFQLRSCSASAKYEIEFVRHAGDELMFTDLCEHLRALCSDVDDEAALALFSSTMDAWVDDSQPLCGRRFAVKQTEALTLLDELNCEFLHTDSLYQVAKTIKNHCRHKGNRKLFLADNTDTCGDSSLLKGLTWMLNDSEPLVRFALFILLQFANDEELCESFFATPKQSSDIKLLLDALSVRKSDDDSTPFTTDMAVAVRQSALFA